MIGKQRWAIPEGYIPERSNGPEPEMESHESICILNPGEAEAAVQITVFFSDREPVGPYEETVPGERTRHLRFNEFDDPEEIPRGTPFASVLESDQPVVCQHTRLDSRQSENALLSTMAYGEES